METDNNQNSNPDSVPSQALPDQSIVNNQRGNVPIIIGVVLLLLIIGTGAYYLGTQRNQPTTSSQQQNIPSNPTNTFQQPVSTTQNDTYSSENSDYQTSQNISKAALLSTNGWQTVSAKNFSIKAPADLVPFVSDPYLIIIRQQKEYIAEKPQFSVGQVGIPEMGDHNNLYTGGSRRQWYLDYYYDPKDLPNVSYTFQEKLFGDINGLEVYKHLKNSQGVETSSIRAAVLVTVGTRLFMFNGSSEYSQIIDTAISTLKIN